MHWGLNRKAANEGVIFLCFPSTFHASLQNIKKTPLLTVSFQKGSLDISIWEKHLSGPLACGINTDIRTMEVGNMSTGANMEMFFVLTVFYTCTLQERVQTGKASQKRLVFPPTYSPKELFLFICFWMSSFKCVCVLGGNGWG